MRFVLLSVCLSLLPTVATAQARYVDADAMTHDEESQLATSLYVIGAAVLTVGAIAAAALGIESGLAGLSFGFGAASSAARDEAIALENGAIAAGCIGGVVGLILIGIAIRFDLDSSSRGNEMSTWWLE